MRWVARRKCTRAKVIFSQLLVMRIMERRHGKKYVAHKVPSAPGRRSRYRGGRSSDVRMITRKPLMQLCRARYRASRHRCSDAGQKRCSQSVHGSENKCAACCSSRRLESRVVEGERRHAAQHRKTAPRKSGDILRPDFHHKLTTARSSVPATAPAFVLLRSTLQATGVPRHVKKKNPAWSQRRVLYFQIKVIGLTT